jgi:hypothetical protein
MSLRLSRCTAGSSDAGTARRRRATIAGLLVSPAEAGMAFFAFVCPEVVASFGDA